MEDVAKLLRRALADRERGVGDLGVCCDEDALAFIAERSGGDARRALSALEVAILSQSNSARPSAVTLEVAAESMQQKVLPYDLSGDTHYDVASALIKSMRGSDPDAALYWLARMLEGGEDPRFIARRIAICASEDVGNAAPRALLVAASAAQVTDLVGLPECQFALAQAVTYIACAPKSNAAAQGVLAARRDILEMPVLSVPAHLRSTSDRGAALHGQGEGYRDPHDFPEGTVDQDYLGADRTYYNPTERGGEKGMSAVVRARRHRRRQAAVNDRMSES